MRPFPEQARHTSPALLLIRDNLLFDPLAFDDFVRLSGREVGEFGHFTRRPFDHKLINLVGLPQT
jgi:hypothetical protein